METCIIKSVGRPSSELLANAVAKPHHSEHLFPRFPGICYLSDMRIFRLVVRKMWESARKFFPGLIVMFIVFLLMRGVSGTIEAMKLQLATFVTSLLGQGDGLSAVVVQTLPLAIAAGIAAFAVRAKLLTFDSPWSFVGIATINVRRG